MTAGQAPISAATLTSWRKVLDLPWHAVVEVTEVSCLSDRLVALPLPFGYLQGKVDADGHLMEARLPIWALSEGIARAIADSHRAPPPEQPTAWERPPRELWRWSEPTYGMLMADRRQRAMETGIYALTGAFAGRFMIRSVWKGDTAYFFLDTEPNPAEPVVGIQYQPKIKTGWHRLFGLHHPR